MEEPTREEIGDLLRRLVDTVVEMKDRVEELEAQLATTPSPDNLVKFAFGHAVGLCCPHEDDDDTARKARQECADAIAFASIAPDTIAAIIKTAGGKKNKSRA
jgi:hypothetical protein